MSISVVLASYNHAPYVGACIESVLSQTRPPDEVIVVDDGSTDRSRDVIASFGSAVRAVYQERRGTYGTLNVGISLASGDWIAIHNSDDLWLREKLERQARLAADCPDIGLVHTGVAYIDASDSPLPNPPGADLSALHFPPCCDMLPVMLRTNAVGISSAMVSRQALSLAGAFDERYLGAGDWDLCLRLSEVCRFGFVDAPLTLVRKHAASAGVDPARIPEDWVTHDREILAVETMPRSAAALADKAQRGEISHAEAAFSLACLGTVYSWEGRTDLARSTYSLALHLQPTRVKTYLRYVTTYLPHSSRRHAA